MFDAKRNRSGAKIDQPLDKAAALPSALLIQRSWGMSQHYLTAGSGTVACRPYRVLSSATFPVHRYGRTERVG